MEVDSATQTACAACGNSANKRCNGCIEGINHAGAPSPTFYCSTDCQKAHWAKHKAECKLADARKQLFRAGELLQAVFYIFREIAFDILIASVWEKGGNKMHFYEKEWEGHEEPLFMFPADSIPEDHDRHALLTHHACGDALAYLHEFSLKVTKGCGNKIVSIVEGRVNVKKKHQRVVHHRSNGPDNVTYGHELLVVTLENDTAYVLDPAGAQYGQRKPVLTFEEYHRERQLGRCQTWAEDPDDPSCPGGDMRVAMVHLEFMKIVNFEIAKWEESRKQTMSEMLNQKHDVYQTDRKEILTLLESGMR